MTNCKTPNGIYETKSFPSCPIWPKDRRVYIQDGIVKLVDYKIFGLTDDENQKHRRLGYDRFDYDWFFMVNILGPRVADPPENFDIRSQAETA